MRPDTSSRTAYRVALRRAVHQIVDQPRVLEDPLAAPILGAEAEADLASAGEDGAYGRALRAFVVARSRYAEDQLAQASGLRQYVVLGAGLDTSAYRPPLAGCSLRIFEVDHPATHRWKRANLAEARIAVPSNLTFAPVDFEHHSLAEELGRAGFELQPTFFSWLGVTPYLTREAFMATMSFIASLPAPTGVVFDYAAHPSTLSLKEKIALKVLMARVARAGEPFRLFFVPAELGALLQGMGFTRVEDLGRDQINARYFAGRADRLQVAGRMGALMSAWKDVSP